MDAEFELPEPNQWEIVNKVDHRREISGAGVAYYGSNWQLGRAMYSADEVRTIVRDALQRQAGGA
jgi:hypothetical protein